MDIDATQVLDLGYDDDSKQIVLQKKEIGKLKTSTHKSYPETLFTIYGGVNIIGRNEKADIAIKIQALSKKHACIEVVDDSCMIYDCGSVNKTRKGKTVLKPFVRYELKDGDELTFADLNAVFTFSNLQSDEDNDVTGSITDAGSETESESMIPDRDDEEMFTLKLNESTSFVGHRNDAVDTDTQGKSPLAEDKEKTDGNSSLVSDASDSILLPTQLEKQSFFTKGRTEGDTVNDILYAADTESESEGETGNTPEDTNQVITIVGQTPGSSINENLTLLPKTFPSESSFISLPPTAIDESDLSFHSDNSAQYQSTVPVEDHAIEGVENAEEIVSTFVFDDDKYEDQDEYNDGDYSVVHQGVRTDGDDGFTAQDVQTDGDNNSVWQGVRQENKERERRDGNDDKEIWTKDNCDNSVADDSQEIPFEKSVNKLTSTQLFEASDSLKTPICFATNLSSLKDISSSDENKELVCDSDEEATQPYATSSQCKYFSPKEDLDFKMPLVPNTTKTSLPGGSHEKKHALYEAVDTNRHMSSSESSYDAVDAETYMSGNEISPTYSDSNDAVELGANTVTQLYSTTESTGAVDLDGRKTAGVHDHVDSLATQSFLNDVQTQRYTDNNLCEAEAGNSISLSEIATQRYIIEDVSSPVYADQDNNGKLNIVDHSDQTQPYFSDSVSHSLGLPGTDIACGVGLLDTVGQEQSCQNVVGEEDKTNDRFSNNNLRKSSGVNNRTCFTGRICAKDSEQLEKKASTVQTCDTEVEESGNVCVHVEGSGNEEPLVRTKRTRGATKRNKKMSLSDRNETKGRSKIYLDGKVRTRFRNKSRSKLTVDDQPENKLRSKLSVDDQPKTKLRSILYVDDQPKTRLRSKLSVDDQPKTRSGSKLSVDDQPETKLRSILSVDHQPKTRLGSKLSVDDQPETESRPNADDISDVDTDVNGILSRSGKNKSKLASTKRRNSEVDKNIKFDEKMTGEPDEKQRVYSNKQTRGNTTKRIDGTRIVHSSISSVDGVTTHEIEEQKAIKKKLPDRKMTRRQKNHTSPIRVTESDDSINTPKSYTVNDSNCPTTNTQRKSRRKRGYEVNNKVNSSKTNLGIREDSDSDEPLINVKTRSSVTNTRGLNSLTDGVSEQLPCAISENVQTSIDEVLPKSCFEEGRRTRRKVNYRTTKGRSSTTSQSANNTPKVEDPANDTPNVEEPANDNLNVEEPANDNLNVEEPANDNLNVEEPANDNLNVEEPANDNLDAIGSASKTPNVEEPANDNLDAKKPESKPPDVEEPANDNLNAEDPANGNFSEEETLSKAKSFDETSDESTLKNETLKNRQKSDGRGECEMSLNATMRSRLKVSREHRRSLGATKPKVIFTGISDKAVAKIVSFLGGEVVDNVVDATHLITDKVRRTVKFLCAVGRGIPIINPDWIKAGKAAHTFISSKDYILSDASAEKQYSFQLTRSLQKASESPLLQNYSIFVTKNVKPEPQCMKEMISCCGGKFLTKLPRSPADTVIVISCAEDEAEYRKIIDLGFTVCNNEILLTGILKQELDTKQYLIGEETNSSEQNESIQVKSSRKRKTATSKAVTKRKR